MPNSCGIKGNNTMDDSNKIVWIVIPTWNRCDDLIECLQSLSRVTYQPTKTLVVDNASEDGTTEKIKQLYPGVDIIQLPENLGAPKASNIGFEQALQHGAEYILRLDSDTIVSPGFLEPLVNKLEDQPNIGVVSPKIYYHNPPNMIWYAGVDAHPWHFGSINDQIDKRDDEIDDQSRVVDYVWGAAMLIRRDVLEKTRGFDPDFFIYYEEIDFCKRVQALGYQLYYAAESEIWHKVGTQNPTAWSAYHWNKSKATLYRKHARNKGHLLLLQFFAFSYALTDAFLHYCGIRKTSHNRGPLTNTLRGLRDGL
jgi:GT2 family glycosyltransferase